MIAGELVVVNDAEDLATRAVRFIARQIELSPTFRFVLSGGSTPRSLYTLLGEHRELPWGRVEMFMGDERFVPLDHPDSNFRMVRETLLAHGVRPGAVHPIATDGTLEEGIARYDALLRCIKAQPLRTRVRRAQAGAAGAVRSIQVVFSCVYFSKACNDLSRPKPDCL